MLQVLLDQLIANPVVSVVIALLTVYALGAIVLVVPDNRSPQSTFAWILWFLLLPVGGLAAYILFGRSYAAFRNPRGFLRQDLGEPLLERLAPLLERQRADTAALKVQIDPAYHRILDLVRHSLPGLITTRNAVEIQQDGEEFYLSLMEDMRKATRYIHLQYFMWQTDALTRQVQQVLIERARAGVEVRLLYDAFGCIGILKRSYVAELAAAGVVVRQYYPVWHLHTLSYRNHRKIAVIDGRAGHMGGMNMGIEHCDGSPHFHDWRDTNVRVEGEGAHVLQGIFAVDWYNATGEALGDERYYPPLEAEEIDQPVQFLVSGPDSRWETIKQLYFYMILAAQEYVYLQTPYFVPDQAIEEALISAARAGVDVRVMVTFANRPVAMPDWAAKTYLARISRAGAKVYFYDGGGRDAYLHSKTMSIDGKVCTIGSANMDMRSFNVNYELNAVLYSPRLVQELERDFMDDMAGSREWTWDEYRRTGFFTRLRDSLARLASPLL